MLPSPATRPWSIKNSLAGWRDARAAATNSAALNSGERGSGPRRARRASISALGAAAIRARARGSSRTSAPPPDSANTTRIVFVVSRPSGMTRRWPDMRKCVCNVIWPDSRMRMCLARRSTPTIRRPPTAFSKSTGAHRYTRTDAMRRPSAARRTARTTASTSGSSGISRSPAPPELRLHNA